MPVVLRHNEQLELNIAEYRGSVSFAELKAMADFHTTNPSFLKSDCLSVVMPGADFSDVGLDALDKLLGHYTALFEPINFQIIRRSAWLCLSPVAQAHVDYWSGKRDASEAMSTTLRQFATIEEAGDWLVLGEAEIIALRTKAGFKELARFEDAERRAAR